MPDFEFHGWTPADEASAAAQEDFLKADFYYADGMYDFVARTTSPDNLHEYLLYTDKGTDWDFPGINRTLCAHIQLDPDARTFTITSDSRPTFDLGAAWLIARGADPTTFRADIGEPGGPANAQEAALREHLRMSGDRYRVVDHDTNTEQRYETWAMLKDTTADQSDTTALLLLESQEWDGPAPPLTVQLARFPTHEQAGDWLANRSTPLVPAVANTSPAPDSLLPVAPPLRREFIARPEQIHAARTRTIQPTAPHPTPTTPTPSPTTAPSARRTR